jgi:hypothetical protein
MVRVACNGVGVLAVASVPEDGSTFGLSVAVLLLSVMPRVQGLIG